MLDQIAAMNLGFRAKKWFGPAEQPLRPAVVQGIDDETENPFDVDSAMTRHWLRATATIVTVERTGEWVDRNEFFDVTLEIELDGVGRYPVRQRQLIPEKTQFEWLPGGEVGVLVNPSDHSKAVLA
ncbi:hypothetical protein TZ00_07605 [Agreia bicolorata]|uniref:Uncharacterized protein n=2 Tax=Agreia bicolorata TaxID=110935 RepID=A0ABR5CFD3_9MICO|nr:hypothetical protein TZ00_07605 [Agreia bicolorata]